ncbi:MAG: hypothetical protein WCQ67_02390 [Treponema sp.]
MKKKIRLLSLSLIISLFACANVFAFSEKDIISPVEGTWSNKQPLVLNIQDGSYLYYSLSSSDPLVSGFAYDGPVVIDQTGSITIYITSVSNAGVRSDFKVNYLVMNSEPLASTDESSLFLQNISTNPIRKYISGTLFSIPSNFKYCMGQNKVPSQNGSQLSVSANNKLERYLPCTISDGKNFWRFIIHTVASESELVSGRTVPFKIENWTTFAYTGEKLIYQIDDGYWSASTEPVALDRNVEHIVRWQSVAYEFGNEVQSYTIPVKPEICSYKSTDGAITFSIPGENNFEIGPSSKYLESGTIASGLYKSIQVDTFTGDNIGGKIIVSVFYDNVYQGDLEKDYLLDKQPPEPPVISSSSAEKFARNKVTISITSEENSEIFYAVSEPLTSDTGFEGSSNSSFDSVKPGEFKLYTTQITLESLDSAAFYKVNSYAVDLAGNKSSISEYRVVVDEYNFYLSPDGTAFENKTLSNSDENKIEPDGSYGNPFTTFSQALKIVNSNSYTRLHLLKDITLESGVNEIKSNCLLISTNSKIILPQDCVIKVSGADFEIQNVIFEKQVGTAYDKTYLSNDQLECVQKMFITKNAAVTFSNCELVGIFSQDGILLDLDSSNIKLENCGITVQAEKYACGISSVDSNVEISKQRITSIAPTCVCYSVRGGRLNVQSSTCTVIGHLCRIAELKTCNATLEKNSFIAKLDEANNSVESVWKDVDTVLIQNKNEINGFIK